MTFRLPALAGALLSGLLLATAPTAGAASSRVPVTPPASVIIQSPNRPMAVPAPRASTAPVTAAPATTTYGTSTAPSAAVGTGGTGTGSAMAMGAPTATGHHRAHHATHYGRHHGRHGHYRHGHHGRHHYRHGAGHGIKETPFDAANCAHVPTSCSRIHSCAQARRALACGVTALDPDHDGIPCEKLCG